MEVPQYTQILQKRLQKIEVEPETATKIIGYLLLNHTPEEIIEYAVGPDKGILALIKEAKAFLSFPHKHIPSSPVPSRIDRPIPNQYMPIQQSISRTFSSPSSLRVPVPSPLWDTHLAAEQQRIQTNIELVHPPFTDLVGDDWWLRNQSELLGLEDQLNSLNYLPPKFSSNYQYQDATLAGGLIPVTKACHYFYKGYCRHGTNCRFSHGPMTDSFSDVYGMGMNDLANDDHFFAPGSLEKLEMEIKELLRMRNGVPVSIASLPMLYQEKFGRPLQADGYLSESQRHGKTGYSLTKLLARLKNSIRLIDRPHGQHSVVLLEDASKYMDYRNERSDLLQAATSSCQIYLTFPADSTFTEEDVLDYFSQFGPVRDVRIPRQEKRMFGFVSFLFPDTVRLIFSKGHPHIICSSRVLVKPYKEKPKLNDRKHGEKTEHPICHPSPFIETDLDSNTTPRLCNSSRLLTKQLIEEMIELESSHICELQLTPKNPTQHPFVGQNIEGMRFCQDIINCPRLLLNKNTTSDDKFQQASNNYNDQDSGHIELPDSPFASQ